MTDFFQSLRDILHGRNDDRSAVDDANALPRAAAVLLLEMSVTDAGGDAEERLVIERAIREHFGLPAEELDALIAEASRLQDESVSLHEYTHRLRTGMSSEQRGDLVGWLWKVALADGELGRHEEHLVRRLADLLGVPHREFIRRKHHAEAGRTGAGDGGPD